MPRHYFTLWEAVAVVSVIGQFWSVYAGSDAFFVFVGGTFLAAGMLWLGSVGETRKERRK